MRNESDEFDEHEANEAKNNTCGRRGNKSIQTDNLEQMQIAWQEWS